MFIILFLHQTTTENTGGYRGRVLFIILFLHQTTTYFRLALSPSVLFIILFLHQTTTRELLSNKQDTLFIILFLHQTTTAGRKCPFSRCCLSSCSYIKPQPSAMLKYSQICCLSSCSYIKPQPIAVNLLVISKILRFELIRNGRAGRFLLQIY